MKFQQMEATKNCRKIDDDEIKQRVFEILMHVKKVCENNNIPYSLCFGTLLGAKRHKGFIPWDDDVDICMLRKDYDRLIEIMKHENGRFQIMSPLENEKYYYNFAKVIDTETIVHEHGYMSIPNYGLYVDVFPLDYCPNSERKFLQLIKKINIYSSLKTISVISDMKYYSGLKKVAIFVLSPVAKLFGFEFWTKCVENKLRNQKSGEYVCCLTEKPKFAEVIKLTEIFPLKSIEFNGELFSCFNKEEDYLRNRYGDYMKLPPVDKQVSHHNFDAYRLSES